MYIRILYTTNNKVISLRKKERLPMCSCVLYCTYVHDTYVLRTLARMNLKLPTHIILEYNRPPVHNYHIHTVNTSAP